MITLINIYTNRVKYLFNVILRLLQENELKKMIGTVCIKIKLNVFMVHETNTFKIFEYF